MVLQQFKMILLSIIALFRRALCCFSRRRKLSHTEHQTLSVVVEPRNCPVGASPPNVATRFKERDWNSWDDSPRSVEEHIEQYRQRIANPPTPTNVEPEQDFFTGLAPTIKPQTKYYLGEEATTAEQQSFSRLQAQTDVPIALNADLEDWVDDSAGGWEELDSEQAKQLIREKRREMRSNRQNTAKTNNGISPRTTTTSNANGIGATRINDMQRSA